MKSTNKIILDLCGGTGAWSKPYTEKGYDVRNITLPMFDVLDPYIQEQCIKLKPYGILSAPPCPMFSFCRTNAKKPRDLQEGMEIVMACLKIIWGCQYNLSSDMTKKPNLKFWALENPHGMLSWFLGHPVTIFNPYDFGNEYKKKTCLWGYFNIPKKQLMFHEEPIKFDRLKTKEVHGEFYGKYDRQTRRAITPSGFAKAFFEANP